MDDQIPMDLFPQVQNVVGTVNLGCDLGLKEISFKVKAAEYNPNRFAALIMKIQNPKATGLIFKSGKMVITGAKSEEECETASRKFSKIILKIGFKTNNRDFKVENVVASCDLKFAISLDKMDSEEAKKQDIEVRYEPEIFPGLIYRLRRKECQMTFLIFASGKVVITGAKSKRDIQVTFRQMYPIIRRYQIRNRT